MLHAEETTIAPQQIEALPDVGAASAPDTAFRHLLPLREQSPLGRRACQDGPRGGGAPQGLGDLVDGQRRGVNVRRRVQIPPTALSNMRNGVELASRPCRAMFSDTPV